MSDKRLDLSNRDLETLPGEDDEMYPAGRVETLILVYNRLAFLPRTIERFYKLRELDISNNNMCHICGEIAQLPRLKSLIATNNQLDESSLPKNFGSIPNLEVLNFSGNQFTEFPVQVTRITSLKTLYFGANNISSLPVDISNLINLEIMYLGGNELKSIPAELRRLSKLESLVLCNNKLEKLPPELARLRCLRSLSLHNNKLTTLPPQILRLNNLCELSLRGNPLVVRFVRDMAYQPPSLLEHAARVVKKYGMPYKREELPSNLFHYLDSASKCVNPKCKGVYFQSRVEHVKFVDFCGKYRLPLMQYLCSPGCVSHGAQLSISSDEFSDEETPPLSNLTIQKVLLG